MKPTGCSRSFEAEALHDGRLAGAERESYERHLKTCVVCAKEMRALADLAAKLRATSPPPADELHARRERTRLLAAFNGQLVEPRPTRPASWSVLALAAVAATVMIAAVVAKRVEPMTSKIAKAEIHAADTAAWSEHVEAGREIVVLDRGTLTIHVSHDSGALGVVVRLPDGELEDTGTTFAVSADSGRTMSVSVEEGSIVLRLRGQAAVTVAAGGRWSAPLASTEPPATSAPSHFASTASAAPQSSTVPKVAAHADAKEGAVDRADEFRDAASRLDRGDACEAAARFAHFIAAYPSDARAEDAAYLRVLGLQRCGDSAATKDAARDYLARFPNGFRRADLEPLAR